MSEPQYNSCFACGKDNIKGLKLQFEYEKNKAICEYMVTSDYQGYVGVVHGGIIATILDEAMAKTILILGKEAVTAEMNVKYRKALPVNKKIHIEGELIESRGRIIKTRSFISIDNIIYAEATAIYVKIRR